MVTIITNVILAEIFLKRNLSKILKRETKPKTEHLSMQIYKIQQSCRPNKKKKIGEITMEYFFVDINN